MKTKDPNYAVKVEKAIADKYGKEAVANPKAEWDDEKEKEYLAELKSNYRYGKGESETIDVGGVLISKELLNRESERSCPVCGAFSHSTRDDVSLVKFDCCYGCYIKWVEGREERWIKGWRPNER